MTMKRVLVGLLTLAGAGCAADSRDSIGLGPYASYDSGAQLAREVPTSASLVRLPDSAGEVLTIIERRSDGVVAQEIALQNDVAALGENKIRVSIGPMNSGDGVLAPVIKPASSQEIAADIAAEFPKMTMRISETVARNGYGPFGYASGSAGGRACLYAWQFVPKVGAAGGGLPGFLAESQSVALRIRLCRTKTPPEDLVAAVEALSMVVAPGQTAYGPITMPAGGDALDSVYPVY